LNGSLPPGFTLPKEDVGDPALRPGCRDPPPPGSRDLAVELLRWSAGCAVHLPSTTDERFAVPPVDPPFRSQFAAGRPGAVEVCAGREALAAHRRPDITRPEPSLSGALPAMRPRSTASRRIFPPFSLGGLPESQPSAAFTRSAPGGAAAFGISLPFQRANHVFPVRLLPGTRAPERVGFFWVRAPSGTYERATDLSPRKPASRFLSFFSAGTHRGGRSAARLGGDVFAGLQVKSFFCFFVLLFFFFAANLRTGPRIVSEESGLKLPKP